MVTIQGNNKSLSASSKQMNSAFYALNWRQLAEGLFTYEKLTMASVL